MPLCTSHKQSKAMSKPPTVDEFFAGLQIALVLPHPSPSSVTLYRPHNAEYRQQVPVLQKVLVLSTRSTEGTWTILGRSTVTCSRSVQCRPEERTWPGQRCERCSRYNYPCSASLTKAEEQSGVVGGSSDLSSPTHPRSSEAGSISSDVLTAAEEVNFQGGLVQG